MRLIDADTIFPNGCVTVWEWDGEMTADGILKAIKDAPTVDAVPVVRCKDCANRGDFLECPLCVHDYNWSDEYQCMDHNFRDESEDDGFCHRGVKKDAVD